ANRNHFRVRVRQGSLWRGSQCRNNLVYTLWFIPEGVDRGPLGFSETAAEYNYLRTSNRCPPKGGLLSRGFDLASCPTKPLSSFHPYRQLRGRIPPPHVIFAVSATVNGRVGRNIRSPNDFGRPPAR